MTVESKRAGYFLDPKNGANRIAGVCALVFCAPLLISLTLVIRFGSGGPAFTTEVRQLNDTGVYQALRFRTARQGSSSGFDRFLNASRLDLLPQLVNVVHGDISIAKVLD